MIVSFLQFSHCWLIPWWFLWSSFNAVHPSHLRFSCGIFGPKQSFHTSNFSHYEEINNCQFRNLQFWSEAKQCFPCYPSRSKNIRPQLLLNGLLHSHFYSGLLKKPNFPTLKLCFQMVAINACLGFYYLSSSYSMQNLSISSELICSFCVCIFIYRGVFTTQHLAQCMNS